MTSQAQPTLSFGTSQAPAFNFATTTTSSAPAFGFGGAATSTAAPQFGFGQMATSQAPSLFGNTAPMSSSFGVFGAPAAQTFGQSTGFPGNILNFLLLPVEFIPNF